MYDPMEFVDRVDEARAASRFGRIVKRDAEGRPTVIQLPGHNASRYRVILRREHINGIAVMSAECAKEAGPIGHIHCNGNMAGVCYHSIAAMVLVAEDSGYKVSFTKDVNVATRLANLGGKVTALYSWQNRQNKVYCVYRKDVTTANGNSDKVY